MSRPIVEYGGGDRRMVVIAGRAHDAGDIDLRLLGCPDELATRIEKREAERAAERRARINAQPVRTITVAETPAQRLARMDDDYARHERVTRLGREIAEAR
jgi:hypothetical protein